MHTSLLRWTRIALPLTALAVIAAVALAQAPAAPAPAAPTAPPSPVQSIRNKISANDLLSAESVAEVFRANNGPTGPWLVGYSWLARGAMLLGEDAKALLYADSTITYCAQRMAAGAKLADDGELEYALGSAIEVKAQWLAKKRGAKAGAEYVRAELAALDGPPSLRSRLNKRLAMLTLTGKPAPELAVEHVVRGGATTLASLRGKPVMLFLYSSTCGDCKAIAPTLARVQARHAAAGLQTVALTSWHREADERAREQVVVDSTWSAVYKGLEGAPVVVSNASMEQYGGSSTPTFVFIDRAGIVRGYTPTRLTDAEFDKALAVILK